MHVKHILLTAWTIEMFIQLQYYHLDIMKHFDNETKSIQNIVYTTDAISTLSVTAKDL